MVDHVTNLMLLGNRRDCPQKSQLAAQDFAPYMLFQKENCHQYVHLIPSQLQALEMTIVTHVLSTVLQVMRPAHRQVMHMTEVE